MFLKSPSCVHVCGIVLLVASFTQVNRKLNAGTSTDVNCSESVCFYNTYIGGVDRGDELRGYYKT